MKTYGQKITWLSPGKWELSWYQDQLTPGNKNPGAVRHTRKTNNKGAKAFCKKHNLEFLKDTHSGRKTETATERRRRYYLHAKLRKQGLKVDAYKHTVELNSVGLSLGVLELVRHGYNAQLTLDTPGGDIIIHSK